MTRVRQGLDEVVIAAVVGVIFIALAYVEGLSTHLGAPQPATAFQSSQGEPVVLLMERPAGAAR
jgi:hypothetical protein